MSLMLSLLSAGYKQFLGILLKAERKIFCEQKLEPYSGFRNCYTALSVWTTFMVLVQSHFEARQQLGSVSTLTTWFKSKRNDDNAWFYCLPSSLKLMYLIHNDYFFFKNSYTLYTNLLKWLIFKIISKWIFTFSGMFFHRKSHSCSLFCAGNDLPKPNPDIRIHYYTQETVKNCILCKPLSAAEEIN